MEVLKIGECCKILDTYSWNGIAVLYILALFANRLYIITFT